MKERVIGLEEEKCELVSKVDDLSSEIEYLTGECRVKEVLLDQLNDREKDMNRALATLRTILSSLKATKEF